MSADPILFARLAARVIDRLPATDRGRVLLVTSARSGEGKTYVAAALAAALGAQTDGAVALVDVSPTSRGTSVGELSPASWSDLVTVSPPAHPGGLGHEGRPRRHCYPSWPSPGNSIARKNPA